MRNLQLSDELATARAEGRKTVTRRLTCPFPAGTVVYHGEALVRSNLAPLGHVNAAAAYRRDNVVVLNATDYGFQPWDWARAVLPARYCPERCARMWSLVREVREEPLHAITEEDAEAEGVTLIGDVGCPCEGPLEDPGPHLATCRWSHPDVDPELEPYRATFAVVWDAIYGKSAPWSRNGRIVRLDLGAPLTREHAYELVKVRDRGERLELQKAREAE